MIIENFMSYDKAEIDFINLHKVLIVGAEIDGDPSHSNGVGKTNLLNAIGWAIWGESRAKTIDENVNWNKDFCSVSVEFEHDGKDCSITRTRSRPQKASTIDFLIDGEPNLIL